MIKLVKMLILTFIFLCLLVTNVQAKDLISLRYFSQGDHIAPSSVPYGNNLKFGHYVQSNDAKIYYEIYGVGKPLFVLHGGGVGTPFEMGQLIDDLRNEKDQNGNTLYQVIVVSSRGHGRSEIGHSEISFEQKANDLLNVMSAVTSEPAILLGFSDGAYTAYQVASLAPKKIDRVIAIGAGTLEKGFFKEGLTVADLEKIDPKFMEQQRKIQPEPNRYGEFFKSYMKFWNSASVGKELLGTIKSPVLLIAGDEDDHAPIITMLKAHQMLENSRLAIIPKAWHTVFLDNYEATWVVIKQFLRELKPTPSVKVQYNNDK